MGEAFYITSSSFLFNLIKFSTVLICERFLKIVLLENVNKDAIKKISFYFILLLILGTGGFFLWQKSIETPPEEWGAAKVSPKEDYMIKETAEGKIVENKTAGLSYKIPKNWILKEGSPTSFYSPDTIFSEKERLQQGCEIDLDISYIRTTLGILEKTRRENISKSLSVINSGEFKRIKIDNYPAIKYGFSVESLKMSYTWIDLPFKNQLYTILLISPTQEEARCLIEFDKFLATVSIG